MTTTVYPTTPRDDDACPTCGTEECPLDHGACEIEVLVDIATDRVATPTRYGLLFAADERALARLVRFVFSLSVVQVTSRRLFDSRQVANVIE